MPGTICISMPILCYFIFSWIFLDLFLDFPISIFDLAQTSATFWFGNRWDDCDGDNYFIPVLFINSILEIIIVWNQGNKRQLVFRVFQHFSQRSLRMNHNKKTELFIDSICIPLINLRDFFSRLNRLIPRQPNFFRSAF